MTAILLQGKPISQVVEEELRGKIAELKERRGVTPCLAAVLVGEDAASEVYVRNKRRACKRIGMESRLHRLAASARESELLALVEELNQDESVHGILVQLPLPPSMNPDVILGAIDPRKDVDAFHPENVGLLVQGRPRFLPCTPHGVLRILQHYQLPVAGKHAVVVGRSDIVGKPLASLLSQRSSLYGPDFANATVTLCHSRTPDLSQYTRQADLLVAAVGKPNCIRAEMVKPGAIVIDVGINRTDEGLRGDVAFDEVSKVASHITPVPGGVGLLTIAMLLVNTFTAT